VSAVGANPICPRHFSSELSNCANIYDFCADNENITFDSRLIDARIFDKVWYNGNVSEQATANYVRREYFLSEALIYFLCSGFIMEATTIPASPLKILGRQVPWFTFPYWFSVCLAILLAVGAVLLFVLSFVHRQSRFIDHVHSAVSASRFIPYIVFVLEMLRLVNELVGKGVSDLFVTPYFLTGFALLILIPAQEAVELVRMRRRRNRRDSAS
jgi:hypothetical protein